MNVPEDFRAPDPVALGGAQLKLAVRLVDGKYITCDTAKERAQRHDMCADLVLQLARYYACKRREQPVRTKEQLLMPTAEALPTKGWWPSQAEIAWCARELRDAVKDKH